MLALPVVCIVADAVWLTQSALVANVLSGQVSELDEVRDLLEVESRP